VTARRRLWAAFGFLAAFAACEVDLASMEPFPCAADGTCPKTFECAGKFGCVSTDQLDLYTPFSCKDGGTCPLPDTYFCVGGRGCVNQADLDSYTPFPCRADGSCPVPETYFCVAGVGCVRKDRAAEYVPFACGGGSSCPNGSVVCLSGEQCVANEPCSIATANCSDPQRPKCSLAYAGATLAQQCVPRTGFRGAGESCQRGGMVLSSGRDDCDFGFYCSGYYSSTGPDSGFECLSLCDRATGCQTGSCAELGGGVGACVPGCTPGQPCPGARDCKLARGPDGTGMVLACQSTGTGVESSGCGSGCARGLACWSMEGEAAVCRRICRVGSSDCQTPDAGSGTCRSVQSGQGLCECELFKDCGGDRACTLLGKPAQRVCRPIGTAAIAQRCESAACIRDAACYGSAGGYFCRRQCDRTHPCPAPAKCLGIAGVPLDGGVCL